jgi:hypothetical protein
MGVVMHRWVVLLAAITLGCSSSDGDADPTPDPDPCAANTTTGYSAYTSNGLQAWSVHPAATDACVDARLDSHFVYVDPAVAAKGRLFLFLPGTGGIPWFYRLIVRTAASEGYHAIGLSYFNAAAVAILCAGQGPDCHGPVRLENLTGSDVSNRIAVSRANSIENRLLRLLAYMQTIDPGRNWSQFVADGAIDWSKVSVAGHSQGGGHALYIAQRHLVLRASAYGSGGDLIVQQPVTWVTEPFTTPADRMYGFSSVNDEAVSAAGAVNAWTEIGLDGFGAATSVDDVAAPWGGSHMLLTSAAPENPGASSAPNHSMVVVDVHTPMAGNVPVFAAVWREMGMTWVWA